MSSIFLHQSVEQRRDLILNGSMLRTLAFLSIPAFMLGGVQALMPVMDGLFITNMTGINVAGAVAYSGPIINMASALAQGLSAAAMAVVGQLNGKGDYGRAKATATQIVVAGFLLGLLSAPLLVLVAALASRGVNPAIGHNVYIYIALNAVVLPFAFMESIYNGLMNANGKPEAPFIRMIIMLLLKLLGNFLFIYILPLGIVGCVLSSLLANLLVTLWMFHELFFTGGADRLEFRGFHFQRDVIAPLAKIGFPAMLNSVFLNLGFLLINNESQKYGPVVLTGQSIAGNISSVCFILPGCLASAVTMMVSMHVGAGNPEKAKRACVLGCVMSAITAVVVIAIIVPLARPLSLLFTRNAELVELSTRALNIYTYSVVGFGICMTVQGAFIGLGRTKVPLLLGLLRIWLLRYVFILATERYLSFYAIFWGNLFSNYAAALLAILFIARADWGSVITQQREPPLRRAS